MNRDHIGGSGADGAAGTHAQTLALYRLLDELRARHPTVEIESCSSGGARIDHEILERTVRVWTSDCNDALERQTIQRGASMLIPPELMGAHIGPRAIAHDRPSHTTSRSVRSPLCSVTSASSGTCLAFDDDELGALASVIALHKRFRPLLHSGDTVRFDTEPAYVAHGVYSADRAEALVSWAVVATAPSLTPPPLRLPGLPAGTSYRVEQLDLPGDW